MAFSIIKRIFFFFLILISQAQAADFIVQGIRVQGLHNVNRNTVLSYLSIKPGQSFNTNESIQLINDLYATGFFSNVSIEQQGKILVINVVERPVIANINVIGNKEIPKDKLDDVLKEVGLVQGNTFNQATLEQIKKSLENQYDSLGKYSARVVTSVTSMSGNRVSVFIHISEGLSLVIADIQIIGNHVFTRRTLLKQLPITTTHAWSFITGNNIYTKEKLEKAIDALRSYYLDRGYLKFQIDSTQVTMTPDRKRVYLVFRVAEGPIYTIKGYHVVSNNLVLPETKLKKLIHLNPGSLFSRKAIDDASEAIIEALGNMGYAFASVNTSPDVDQKARSVFITFYVDPGNRIYVRRINFTGNIKTQDTVFRRLLRQMEGSLISVNDIKESERQLNTSGYLDKEASINTIPVPGNPDEVDLNINVKETPAAQATFGIGYGTNGITLTASLNQNNFLGTGNRLGINFSTSKYSSLYSINYSNPYYTLDGIQRSFSIYYQRTTPANLNITEYITNSYGASVGYVFPLSASGDNLSTNFELQHFEVTTGGISSQEVMYFIEKNGSVFQQGIFNIGWNRNSLDRYPFPTKGINQNAGVQLVVPVGGNPINYYKTNYDIHVYYPLIPGFIFTARGAFGYGNGFASTKGLPFFANYYAGGVGYDGQVRGYAANTLGPKTSTGGALGGNIMSVGSAGLIFPTPIGSDTLRSTVFVDAGNVFTSLGVSTPGNPRGGTPAGPIRYSSGIAVDWRVPVFNALVSLSMAKAINPQPGDITETFQFSIGTSF